MKIILALAASTLAFSAAQAQEIGYAEDALAYSAMMDGNWERAERQLAASADELSADPARLLNLAQVYAATGRDADARAIYQQVLAGEDMTLVLSDDRKVSAHMIAGAKLATVERASR
ncbi:MAG: tetratricopeptide repeat protein [Pacificimonas sp.]